MVVMASSSSVAVVCRGTTTTTSGERRASGVGTSRARASSSASSSASASASFGRVCRGVRWSSSALSSSSSSVSSSASRASRAVAFGRGRRWTCARRAEASRGDDGGGFSGGGRGGHGGGGGGGDDGGENDDGEDENEDEVGRQFKNERSAEEVERVCEENGLDIPQDLLEADGGMMRADVLDLYVKYSKVGILAFLMNMFPAVRDRMLADPRFAFKLLVETGADAVMNTAMELKQRRETFWDEFEFFACDQIAAFAVNTAIITICSPAIVLGNTTRSMRKLGELSKNANGATKLMYKTRQYIGSLPPNVFMINPKLGMLDKLVRGAACVVARGGQIFFVSTLCGAVGQMTANSLMMLRRAAGTDKYSKAYAASIDDSVDPPVIDTGLLWGRFMCVSANVRQQLVIGGERAVESFASGMSHGIARRWTRGTTIALRMLNNVKGGHDFNEFVIAEAIAEAGRRGAA